MVFRKNIIYFLILIAASIWLAVFSIDDRLHIIACDVGQGDAILIQKNTTQILIDGGPNKSVLTCLGKYMPFYDRQIELVILTHPQADHYGGLLDVFKTYNVAKFAEYNRNSSSPDYRVLQNAGVLPINLTKGTKMRLGLIYLDIVVESKEQGIVTLLRYLDHKALFMADVENKVSDELSENSEIQNTEYIKLNHHGSKNGITQKLLDAVKPKTAIISVGKNSYGHPSEEVIRILSDMNIKIKRTDQLGDIDVVVD